MTQETPSSPPADASPATTDIARRDSQQLRRSTVGVLGIAFLVISAAAPLTAMAGGAPVAMLLGNGPGIPAAYVVVSVILLIFSVGYTAMARHHTSTGAFYSFVARGLRQPAGGAAAMAQLGHTHRTHLSPHTGSLSQSILALIVVLIFVITGQDPVQALFTWLTQLGTLAIIVLTALASFAVVAFFARHRDLDSNVLRTTAAPIVGGVAMTAVAIYAASQFGLLIGNPESPLRWILPALIVAAAIAGIIAAVGLRSRSPELYTQMGRHRDIELLPGA